MSQHNDTGYLSHFASGEDLVKNRLVRLNSSMVWVYCDASEIPMGYTLDNSVSGEYPAVRQLNTPGTIEVCLTGTVTLGARLYTANDGKVSTTVSGTAIGVSNKAVSSNGSADAIIEIVPQFGGMTPTFKKIRHVVTAGEALADTLTITTGLGVALTWWNVQNFTSAGVGRADTTLTVTAGVTAGDLVIASTTYAADDVLMIEAGYGPQTI